MITNFEKILKSGQWCNNCCLWLHKLKYLNALKKMTRSVKSKSKHVDVGIFFGKLILSAKDTIKASSKIPKKNLYNRQKIV